MTQSSSTLAPSTSREVHAAVTLLSAAAFFGGAALRICDGLIPRVASDFSLTTGGAGRIVLAFAIAYSVMQLVFGPLGDRFGKLRVVAASLVGCTVMSLAAALAANFGLLLAARVLWGMAAAGAIPPAMAWIGDAVPYEERQATLAKLMTGTLSGMISGQLAGGLFADSAWGWRGAFATMTVGYGLIAALLLVRMRALAGLGVQHAARPWVTQLRAVLDSPWSRKVLAAVAVEGIFLMGPFAFMPAMLHQRFGISVAAASAMVALYAVGGLVYAMSVRWIVRRFGERRMVFWGGCMMGLGYLLWFASPVAWTAAPIALLVGFGTYLFHNTLQTHATQMTPAARGTAVALFAFSFFLGQAIGVSLAGFALDHLGIAAMLLVPAVALPITGAVFARALLNRHIGG